MSCLSSVRFPVIGLSYDQFIVFTLTSSEYCYFKGRIRDWRKENGRIINFEGQFVSENREQQPLHTGIPAGPRACKLALAPSARPSNPSSGSWLWEESGFLHLLCPHWWRRDLWTLWRLDFLPLAKTKTWQGTRDMTVAPELNQPPFKSLASTEEKKSKAKQTKAKVMTLC